VVTRTRDWRWRSHDLTVIGRVVVTWGKVLRRILVALWCLRNVVVLLILLVIDGLAIRVYEYMMVNLSSLTS
jgi:hypothetical protein